MEISYQNLYCFYSYASQTQKLSIKIEIFYAISILYNIRHTLHSSTGLRNEHETKPCEPRQQTYFFVCSRSMGAMQRMGY
jgi:hypothetical protein